MPQSSPGLRRLPAFIALLLPIATASLAGQERQRANGAVTFLKEPSGIRLGTLVAGVEYAVGRSDRTWIAATVEGWIPANAVEPTTRDGFDFVVIANGGEALRSAPGGAVVARIVEGTLLARVTVRGKWIRVRREGWVARSGLDAAKAVARADPPPARAAAAPRPAADSVAARAAPSTRPGGDSVAPADSAAAGSDRVTLRNGAVLSVTADGQPIAELTRAGTGTVLERSRDWVKVRIEGWVKSGDVTGVADGGPRITGAMIRADPDRYVGQPVSWRLQLLAIREADELRPEMARGQLYLLTRGPLPESGFVYVTVTKQQAEEYRRLQPLDEIRIDGVIRAGRTKYLPTPVVEPTGR